MNKFYAILVAAIAFMVPASAEGECYATTEPDVTTPAAVGPNGGALYVDNDPCQPVIGDGSCTFSIWVYEETNGIDGLQRDDEVQSDVSGCSEESGVVGDTIHF